MISRATVSLEAEKTLLESVMDELDINDGEPRENFRKYFSKIDIRVVVDTTVGEPEITHCDDIPLKGGLDG